MFQYFWIFFPLMLKYQELYKGPSQDMLCPENLSDCLFNNIQRPNKYHHNFLRLVLSRQGGKLIKEPKIVSEAL